MRLFRKLDRHERQVLDNIRDHGCQVQFIFDDKNRAPDFAYSIGFPVSVGQPEVIVFGLRRELMILMVNEVRRQCAEENLILSDGVEIGGLIEGFDCVAREVADANAIREHFGWAIWYHRSQRGEEMKCAYQLIWPGKLDGLYPWDEGCDEFVIENQPSLYLEGTFH